MSRPDWPSPNDVYAERAVLAELLDRPEAIDCIVGRLIPDDIYEDRNRWVLTAMLAIHAAGQQITVSSVCSWLQQQGRIQQVEKPYLVELMDTTPSVLNLDAPVRSIRDRARQRRAIKLATEIAATGETWTGEVQQYLDRAESAFHDLSQQGDVDDSLVTIRRGLEEKWQAWSSAREGRSAVGIETGLADVDRLIQGLRPGTLTYLAARPGVGKSSLAANNLAVAVARRAGAVALFSLEMLHDEVLDRMIASEGRIPLTRMRSGELNDEQHRVVAEVNQDISSLPIWIDDRAGIGIAEMRAKCARVTSEAKRSHGVGLALLVVDYMQLMAEPYGSRSRENAVGSNSRDLKRLAKDLRIPVVALAQLNRENDKANRRPKLSDLRESGSLEADADMVWLLHRPKEDEPLVEFIVAKNRGGPTGRVELHWTGPYTRFDNVQQQR